MTIFVIAALAREILLLAQSSLALTQKGVTALSLTKDRHSFAETDYLNMAFRQKTL
jgi:hypothetical protein